MKKMIGIIVFKISTINNISLIKANNYKVKKTKL